MKAKETESTERIANVTAKYDWLRQKNAPQAATPKDDNSERIERFCQLAPAVRRRIAQPKPE